jgi:chromosome segregation ATPase
MRTIILMESLLLVCIALNYILKCLEYKVLRDLFDNRGNSIKMLNAEVEDYKARIHAKNIQINMIESARDRLRNYLYNNGAEVARLRHKVYVLKKDIKRKDRAIVRYKAQNETFRRCYHVVEKRNTKLSNKLVTTENVAEYYKGWYKTMQTERDAYLYCLRQIQEEVENAKKE